MRTTRIIKLLDYVFVLRPTLFVPVWTVFAAGTFAYQRTVEAGVHTPSPVPLYILLLLTLLMGGAFILNQLCDVVTDERNHKLFLIAQKHISPRSAWIEMILLTVVAITAALFHSMAMAGLFAAIFLLTGILYSVYPFQWKDRPFWGLLSNALGALLIFGAGWWSVDSSFAIPLRQALPYMLAVAAVYLYTTLLDIDGDSEARKVTFGVKYGWRTTLITGAMLELAATGAGFWMDDPMISYPALISAPFFLWAAIKQRRRDASRAIKLPILFLALAIAFQVWQYLLVLIFLFSFSKWYYRRRFHLQYPSLRPE